MIHIEHGPQQIPLIDQLIAPGGVESFVKEGRTPWIINVREINSKFGDRMQSVAIIPPYGVQSAAKAERTIGPNYVFFDSENNEIGRSESVILTQNQKSQIQTRIEAISSPKAK